MERSELMKSILPLATVDPKGKAPETPSSKHKKRKLIKPLSREIKEDKAHILYHVCC